MLLCLSSSCGLVLVAGFRAGQELVDLAGDISFEAADDLFLGQALGGAALDVGTGGGVVAHAGDDDHVEGAVGLPVAAAVEPVASGFAAGGRDRGHPA